MLESLDRNFGLLIAFVLPGFLFLVGLVELADQFSIDLPPQLVGSQQLGDFLYFLLASTAAGVGLSGLRWVIVDRLLHATGLEPPALNFQKLEAKHASFMLVVENNYRFYLFYANCLVASTKSWWQESTTIRRFTNCLFACANWKSAASCVTGRGILTTDMSKSTAAVTKRGGLQYSPGAAIKWLQMRRWSIGLALTAVNCLSAACELWDR